MTAADDPWARWDVAWEDVSRPIDEAVRVVERIAPFGAFGEGECCAVCSGVLTEETWSLGVHNGKPALVHAPNLWRQCSAALGKGQ